MCEIVYNILITNFTVHRYIIRSNAPSNLQMQPLGCIFVYALNCITFGTAIDEAVVWLIQGFLPIFVRSFWIQRNYRLSRTEGCAEGVFFCLPAAETPFIRQRGGCSLDGLAHTHNEKPCPVTICKGYRYEGVHYFGESKKGPPAIMRRPLYSCFLLLAEKIK